MVAGTNCQAITEANLNAMDQRAQNYAVPTLRAGSHGDFPVKDTGALDMRAIGIVESGGKHLMLTAASPRQPVLRAVPAYAGHG
jgi:hypothetical protein